MTLMVGVLTLGMTACSKDLSTEPATDPSAGAPKADVVIVAAPANDDFGSAVVIPALPFTDHLNTAEATPSEGDPPDCFGNGPTVWYRFTPTENSRINANTSGSDYDTGLAVYTGTSGDLTEVGCNDDFQGTESSVTFDAIAGVAYFFKIGAFASGPGGNLVFNVDVGQPALAVDLTIDPVGSVNGATGIATIRGTVTCSRAVLAEVSGTIRQRIGRAFIQASFYNLVECDGVTSWEMETFSANGLLVGGRAEVSAFANFFDASTGEVAFAEESRTVRLGGTGTRK